MKIIQTAYLRLKSSCTYKEWTHNLFVVVNFRYLENDCELIMVIAFYDDFEDFIDAILNHHFGKVDI